MLPVSVFLFCMITAVFGWQCPNDVETKRVYVKSGEQAVISFNTTIKSNYWVIYSVTKFDQYVDLYTAQFYKNTLQKENLYRNSKFIGNATAGNFTIKMASVKKEDGGTYMLQYYTKSGDRKTEQCAMLYILDKPKKAIVYHEKINIEGNNTTLTCTSISTTYPTNHALNLTYNWKLDTVTNPSNTRYVYSLNRDTIFIKSIGKEDANASITCSATESGDDVIGFTSDESEKSLLVVYYGPDMCEINRKSPYMITEGDNTSTIDCIADCYPSCACFWRNESSGSSFTGHGSFNITTISRYHTGIYKCICRNTKKYKEQTLSLYIKVEYIDFFVNEKEGQREITFDEYSTDVNLTCVVDTYFGSTLQLLFEDKLIRQKLDSNALSFTISSMTCLHSGIFTCKGHNQHGSTFKESIRIFVRCSPRPDHQIKENFTSSMYSMSTLSFTAIAYPEPGPKGFVWHKEKSLRWEKLLSNTDIQISSSLLQSNLTIRNVTSSDYGHYRVTVTNDIDTFEQHLFLVKEDKSRTSQIATENICSDTGITWMIVGIIFGLLSAVLSGYAIYVTILLKRNTIREGKEETARPTESIYYEKVGETSRIADTQSKPGAANTDEYERSVTMYTDLVRYSKDDGRNYDIILHQ